MHISSKGAFLKRSKQRVELSQGSVQGGLGFLRLSHTSRELLLQLERWKSDGNLG